MNLEWTELIIFTILFAGVSAMGFVAARWRRPTTMEHLNEWGLGGRNFGTWISWFLIGGDLYTAYTFVAVPALVFGAGAAGFFALPYTVIAYPIVFMFLIKLWSVSKEHGFVTPADFVRARFGSPLLALLVAITGLVATMPYIALQLVGIEAVLKSMGLTGSGLAGHLPIVIAFAILAAYTYQSGLRAPALIAFVKDILIYVVILVAVIYIPTQLGGWDAIFDKADTAFTESGKGGLLLNENNQLQYISLALGSALALFLYPHSVTGVLSSRSRNTIKRNMSALPAYSFLLGLIALLGFMALAAGTKPLLLPNGNPDTSTIVPELFNDQFSDWFTGVAFAAVGIGALVPAAIMSIAAANLFTRNIYREYIRKDATPAQETKVSKLVSLVVKVGAVVCIIVLPLQFAIDLQLIGGVIILQTLPSLALGVFTRWFHKGALIGGWFAGMGGGMLMLYFCPSADGKRPHFGGSAFPLEKLGFDTKITVYAGLLAIALNLLVVVLLTPILKAMKVADGKDGTKPLDYYVDEGDEEKPPPGDEKPEAAAIPTA
ncbi:monocarboxylate uptake permease MctP [Stackebrandtia nassauensis]|uniref:Na+/solute symporter n=1 Tax=Stackebrandtia nassauensis (strain DSM 44728 / CIP 108903 / NRRL B-16338 / NBRC 102104 / LLR-40K-21) TaxID=446470 RepID=D3PZE3_STANL|nr:sodium:solute symporter family protein [Stackebrandtia nassauensis]ADD41617.1 Na+/solute symporter [Stackebrandtia nassauensis DSM 44728]